LPRRRERLPIPEGTVDLALTEDPSQLRFIRRCLAPGGRVLSPDGALSNALRDAGLLARLRAVVRAARRRRSNHDRGGGVLRSRIPRRGGSASRRVAR